jgi:hypothetical protein
VKALGLMAKADYAADPVEMSDAQEMVEQAQAFVSAMRAEFIPPSADVA